MIDEVIQQDFHYQNHTDVLTARQTQPTEDLILSRNAELRKMPGALRDIGEGSEGGSFGRQIASVPIIMFEKAKRDGFDLSNTDSKIAGSEMHRFLQTNEGRMCLVQDSTAKSSTKYFKGN
jgi:hypothetical protein